MTAYICAQLRLTRRDHTRASRLAAKDGLTLSAFLRRAVLAALTRRAGEDIPAAALALVKRRSRLHRRPAQRPAPGPAEAALAAFRKEMKRRKEADALEMPARKVGR